MAAPMSLKVQSELAQLAYRLAHNPKTRKGFAELCKLAGEPIKFDDIEKAA